jgi:small GTP-binding protein
MLLTREREIQHEVDSSVFVEQELNKELLRFTTAGSVDDGKSTLIGRLLHDCKGVYEDQLASVKKSRINRSGRAIDFSLLTDGLRAEREQGITIDVAYRYFSTARRKFIIADTPGHEQYTRNMATGASTADLAVILVDATKGLLAQTRRHAYIASLLGISRLLTVINKMDLVDYREEIYSR